MSLFSKAIKSKAKLRMAITGPSGSGKTYSALAIGSALSSKIALVDTEHGSAAKYASDFEFDVLEMGAPFHPDRYIEAIEDAEKAGYEVLVLDSLSHAWNGAGGLLEIVDQIAARMKTSNTFAAWKDATPIQNRLVEAIVGAKIHIIATMRSKQEYVIEQVNRNGKMISVPKKIGTAPVQRDSFEYEFDVVGDMDLEHNLIISKTRCRALDNAVINRPGADLAETITAWLSDGAVAAPKKSEPVSSDRPYSPGVLREKIAAFVTVCKAKNLYHDPETGDPFPVKLHPFGDKTANLLAAKWEGVFKGQVDDPKAAYKTSLGYLFFGVDSANDLTAPEAAAMFKVMFNGKADDLSWDSEVLDVAKDELLATCQELA